MKTRVYTFRVLVEPDADGFHGYVPALPGCHTWGKNLAETRKNLREAIELYIEDFVEEKQTVPKEESLESFETVTIPFKNSGVHV